MNENYVLLAGWLFWRHNMSIKQVTDDVITLQEVMCDVRKCSLWFSAQYFLFGSWQRRKAETFESTRCCLDKEEADDIIHGQQGSQHLVHDPIGGHDGTAGQEIEIYIYKTLK